MSAEQVELFHVDTPTAPETRPEDLSPDRRRTLRQHQQIADGWHPLTGSRTRPELGTCGTCAHRIRVAAFQHPKCEFGPWSKSAATDVRRWWPACERWEAAGAPTTAPPEPDPAITANCFYACGHAVDGTDPVAVHAAMEAHYRERHAPPSDRLERAAVHLGVDTAPHSLPAPAIAHLARLLRAEATWAAERADTYPADRAPLLQLADLILEGP